MLCVSSLFPPPVGRYVSLSMCIRVVNCFDFVSRSCLWRRLWALSVEVDYAGTFMIVEGNVGRIGRKGQMMCSVGLVINFRRTDCGMVNGSDLLF